MLKKYIVYRKQYLSSTNQVGVGVDFDTFKNDTFKSVIFIKKKLIDFLDELGNFKQKKIYTFDFYTFKNYTFESVSVDAHCL